LVHRDLKSANIFLGIDESGGVRLGGEGDFEDRRKQDDEDDNIDQFGNVLENGVVVPGTPGAARFNSSRSRSPKSPKSPNSPKSPKSRHRMSPSGRSNSSSSDFWSETVLGTVEEKSKLTPKNGDYEEDGGGSPTNRGGVAEVIKIGDFGISKVREK
jgi:serine/threonine protein kinase